MASRALQRAAKRGEAVGTKRKNRSERAIQNPRVAVRSSNINFAHAAEQERKRVG